MEVYSLKNFRRSFLGIESTISFQTREGCKVKEKRLYRLAEKEIMEFLKNIDEKLEGGFFGPKESPVRSINTLCDKK